ncbi:MAG TPA: ExeM/NucH family extracellular endonuclease [Anaerolineales bacterium]|nr:ExeM/NucH family extracellular endonuclease [Anaerolineales bacterium]
MSKLFSRSFSVTVVLALMLSLLPFAQSVQAAPALFANPTTTVFINEIHYDNASTDEGEAIEIAGPAGTDLTGWSVVLYNGNGGAVYNTTALSGVIADQGGGYGTVVVNYPSNGIQNGSPDGVALVNGGALVQFLSYEGSFNGVGGPADGVASTDIGVAESSGTLVGDSLQLTGSGTTYGDFTWSSESANSFGALNTGQTFGGAPTAKALVINEIDYDQPGTDAAEFVEIRNNDSVSVDLSAYSLQFVNGNGGSVYDTITLPAVSLAAGDYFVVCANAATVANCDLDDSPDTNFIQNGAPDAVALYFGSTLIDTVSYEGDTVAPYTEGSGAGLVDNAASATEGISRCADGSDTDQNNVDFSLREITPGAANACSIALPQIVINEIMQNPSIVFDSAGEWFELYNPGSSDVDIDGWTVADNDDDSFVISGTVVIPAGGYAILGNNANSVTNGGVTVNYEYSGMFLGNSADEIVLLDGSLAEVDRVEYDNGVTFPDPNGASMSLENSASDNNVGANWCTSTTPFGAGDLGTPGAENTCVAPVTLVKIHEVQGAGSASPLVGQTVAVEGIVVGDFQDDVGANGDLNGFYVQEEDADADGNPLTSEGVFVFQGSNPTVDVAIGDHVRVEGSVSEYFGDTQITSFSGVTVNSSGNPLPAVSVLSLPVTDVSDFEAYEGMYVTFPQALVISEYFNFDRFGEIVLTDARHFQPTAVFEPGSTDAADLATANSLARITLDDGRTSQNPDPAIHPNGLEFNLGNLFRGGDTVENVTGVINYAFGLYRVQPTQGATYVSVNPRTASPDPVGGNVTVASFNVLNYFTTLDNAGSICGPLANQGCRGADNAEEFTRQRAKIIAALVEIDADVVGLMEIENHIGDVPTADLVSGLNDMMGAGTYDYIATGAMGSDAIRQAFIYKPANVTPFGSYAVLDTPAFLDPNNTGSDKNRPALAQTFSVNSTGGVFTAVVNHLKSKGSGCGAGDDDPEAGSCNLTRTLSAQVLLNWLDTDPTGSDDEDFMIIGDLNSYDKEDPIDVLVAGGYTDLAYEYQGEYAYSYVFSGQWGYLDYALANAALLNEVTSATEWHINADEADLIDYDTSFKQAAQDAIYAPDAYRSSDHDPVIVGMELTTEAEIYELIDAVQKLLDDDVLNGGQANALTSKLENILDKLANGHTNAAANQLGAFINQVEAFVNGGTLTPEQGDAFIKAATLLVDALN